MSFLKALKRTTIVAGAAGMLAFGATAATATTLPDTSVLGHISVSVVGTLYVTEVSAINFGNISFAGATGCAGGTCVGDVTLTLGNEGNRTLAGANTDGMTLLVGVQNGTNDANGIADGSNLGTGGQAPGFYQISNADGVTNVYVSFSNNAGAIIDSNHPNNYVSLTGGTGGQADEFRVQNFTWEMDDSASGPSGSGYTGTTNTQDIYGQYVACGASCTIRVGADLHTVAAAPKPDFGQFTGTFYLMVSY